MIDWIESLPIVVIGSILTIIFGTSVWLVLDSSQSNTLNEVLDKNINSTLDNELSDARIRFSQHLDAYLQLGFDIAQKLESLDKKLINEVLNVENGNGTGTGTVQQYRWGFSKEFWYYHLPIDWLLLYDQNLRLVNSISRNKNKIPNTLLNIEPYLLEISENDTYLFNLDGHPALLSSRQIKIKNKFYSVLITKVFDYQFMIDAQKSALSLGRVVALLDSKSQTLITSSAPNKIIKSMSLKQIEEDYQLAGKQFFDYGNSELEVQFSLLIPKDMHQKLKSELLSLNREHRLIVILVMASMMFMGLFLIVRAILILTRLVSQHSSLTFHFDSNHHVKGNELYYLKTVFDRFALRAFSDKQIEEHKHISDKRQMQLSLTDKITDILDVGVLTKVDGSYLASNEVMQSFIEQCGGIEIFTEDPNSQKEIYLKDNLESNRFFQRSKVNLDSGDEVILIRDISKQKKYAQSLEHLAHHDLLTGLPNRVLLNDRLKVGVRLAHRENKECYLFIMDLNRFKHINDTFGHNIGDELLKQVAHRMQSKIRASDTLARLGGDEFAILLVNCVEGSAIKIAKNIKHAVSKPYQILENRMEVGVSIGIVSADKSPHSNELLSFSDQAMYYAKRNELDYCIYSEKIDPNRSKRLAIIESFANKQFLDEVQLYYQPQISSDNEAELNFEVLIRWHHSTLGFLSPDEFISIAESYGFINELTHFVIELAITQADIWLVEGHKVNVSINLSAANFKDINLIPLVSKLVNDAKIEPSQITLEITESMLMDDILTVIDKLNEIKDLGLRVSIDDFGTGFSSLSYLQKMPVDELKIDKSFISELTTGIDHTLVRSIIELAHNLNIEVVAEGVETEYQQKLLKELNCERQQGYLFSKPVPVDQLDLWIN